MCGTLISISPNFLPLCAIVSFVLLFPFGTTAQDTSGAAAATQPPVPYASVSELNDILEKVKQTAQNMQTDLGRTRIERWKADPSTKRQSQANVESIQRNLQS